MQRFTCPVCGNRHDDLPVYTFEGPAFWKAADAETRARDFKLGTDLCEYKDEHFLIRGRLPVMITDSPGDTLEFGVWVAISRDNFERYRDTHLDDAPSTLGVFYGWLANAIPGYEDTVNLKVQVQPQGFGLRPFFAFVPDREHELVRQQQDGITLDEAMRWLHERGGF